MATYYPASVFPLQYDDPSTGALLSGGTIEAYLAGTSTPTNMFTDVNGTSAGATITLDSGGFPSVGGNVVTIWLETGVSYKLVLKDAAGSTIDTQDNISGIPRQSLTVADYAALRALDVSGLIDGQIASVTNSGIFGDFVVRNSAAHGLSDNGGIIIVIDSDWYAERVYSGPIKTEWFETVQDGATDNTSAILAIAATYKNIEIPYNCLYDPYALMSSLPTDVVIFDYSQINSFKSAGETTKEIGILSKDEAVSDTHKVVASDHHAIFQMNNYGGAGSASAAERKVSILWASGKFTNAAATDKNGWRGSAIKQYTKGSGSYWIETLRSLAPWTAIDASYERWKTAEVIGSTGIYRQNGTSHYVSASTGTTGGTAPVHTSGTVSDGGVDWTYVDSSDRTIYQVDEYGRWLIGTGSAGSTFRHKVGLTDPGTGEYTMQLAARGNSQNVRLSFYPTNSSGTEVLQPYFLAQEGVGLRIFSSGGTEIARFNDDLGILLKENARQWTMAADGDATPSVERIATLYTQNTGATSITFLDDADDGQVVDIVIIDANTTLVHSSSFMLSGSANVTTPAAYSTVTMQKVPSSISNRWIEVSRSIK